MARTVDRLRSSWAHNLGSLLRFRGRDPPVLFWPYAISVILLSQIVWISVFLIRFAELRRRLQEVAVRQPEQVAVSAGPGQATVRIEGHDSQVAAVMISYVEALAWLAAAVDALLAAAMVRRLHDTGRSALWAAAPLPFIAFMLLAFPRFIASPRPDFGLFGSILLSNLLSLGLGLVLLVFLFVPSEPGENRYGPAPAGQE